MRVVVTTASTTKFGSTVIFDEDDTSYYLLTNHHVIDEYVSIETVDYYNDSYDAELVENSGQSIYDLAIIKVEKIKELSVLEIEPIIQLGDSIISVGYPNSIFGLTYGNVTDLETIVHDITFSVIHHSAYIVNGSSGGALLNQDHEIVGINFAVYMDQQGYVESYAVPSINILEYLNIIGYEMG